MLTQDRLQQAESMTSTMSRARTMGEYAVYFHDPDLINTILAKYSEITPADIQRVAREYLGASAANRRFDNSEGATRPGSIEVNWNSPMRANKNNLARTICRSCDEGNEETDET